MQALDSLIAGRFSWYFTAEFVCGKMEESPLDWEHGLYKGYINVEVVLPSRWKAVF